MQLSELIDLLQFCESIEVRDWNTEDGDVDQLLYEGAAFDCPYWLTKQHLIDPKILFPDFDCGVISITDNKKLRIWVDLQ